MQATVVKVAVAEGDKVVKGDLVLVLEAMKMEQPIVAHKDGVIGLVNARAARPSRAATCSCRSIADAPGPRLERRRPLRRRQFDLADLLAEARARTAVDQVDHDADREPHEERTQVSVVRFSMSQKHSTAERIGSTGDHGTGTRAAGRRVRRAR